MQLKTFNGACKENLLNPLSGNFTKWPNTLKQFVTNLPTNFLSVFDHFVGLVLKGLKRFSLQVPFIQKPWFTDFLCKSPSIPQVILLCFTPSLPNKHMNALVENPFRQKNISGVWGHVFGSHEQVSYLFHNSCIEKTL